MNFTFTEEQEELRATASAFLTERAGSEALRAALDARSARARATPRPVDRRARRSRL